MSSSLNVPRRRLVEENLGEDGELEQILERAVSAGATMTSISLAHSPVFAGKNLQSCFISPYEPCAPISLQPWRNEV